MDIIQGLRGLAALSVMLVHFDATLLMLIGQWPQGPLTFGPAAAGVDLFFVISGFVMVYASEPLFTRPYGARIFLVKRIIRLVPLYWLATVTAIWAERTQVDALSLFKSLFFIPYTNSSGGIEPLYGVGWTLNFEMYFYAIFALAIYLGRAKAIALAAILIVTDVLSGWIFRPTKCALVFWTDPIALEFLFGMGLAVLYRRGVQLPACLAVCLCLSGVLLILPFTPGQPPSGLRVVEWGIPAMMILGGAVLSGLSRVELPRIITTVGDASYSIYLIHSLVAAGILIFWNSGLNQYPINMVLSYGGVATILLSVTIFRFFERPVTSTLRRALNA